MFQNLSQAQKKQLSELILRLQDYKQQMLKYKGLYERSQLDVKRLQQKCDKVDKENQFMKRKLNNSLEAISKAKNGCKGGSSQKGKKQQGFKIIGTSSNNQVIPNYDIGNKKQQISCKVSSQQEQESIQGWQDVSENIEEDTPIRLKQKYQQNMNNQREHPKQAQSKSNLSLQQETILGGNQTQTPNKSTCSQKRLQILKIKNQISILTSSIKSRQRTSQPLQQKVRKYEQIRCRYNKKKLEENFNLSNKSCQSEQQQQSNKLAYQHHNKVLTIELQKPPKKIKLQPTSHQKPPDAPRKDLKEQKTGLIKSTNQKSAREINVQETLTRVYRSPIYEGNRGGFYDSSLVDFIDQLEF